MDTGGVARNAFASLVAVGPRASAVAERMHATALRLADEGGVLVAARGEEMALTLPQLAGSVVFGVSDVAADGVAPPFTVGRIAAESVQDVVRIVRECVAPLEAQLGVVPYDGRIHAATSLPQATTPLPAQPTELSAEVSAEAPMPVGSRYLDRAQRMALMQLCDASLPTGGFAHSGGLEAASQLGILLVLSRRAAATITTEAHLIEYISAAAASYARQHAPCG